MLVLSQSEKTKVSQWREEYTTATSGYKRAVVELKLSHWLSDIRADITTIKRLTSYVTNSDII